MLGLMQDWPLLVTRILEHAAQWHGDREIVSRSVEGPIHRTTYAAARQARGAIASAVHRELKIKRGDVVATMAWNGWRHLEAGTA